MVEMYREFERLASDRGPINYAGGIIPANAPPANGCTVTQMR